MPDSLIMYLGSTGLTLVASARRSPLAGLTHY